MKRYTEKKAAKAINKILNFNRRQYKINPALLNPVQIANGKYIITDGFTMLCFDKLPEGIENYHVPDLTEEQKEKAKRMLTQLQILYDRWFIHLMEGYSPIIVEKPTQEQIKNRTEKYKIRLSNGQLINPLYLQNVLSCFPGVNMYSAGKYNPVLFIDTENGFNPCAAILPIRE